MRALLIVLALVIPATAANANGLLGLRSRVVQRSVIRAPLIRRNVVRQRVVVEAVVVVVGVTGVA